MPLKCKLCRWNIKTVEEGFVSNPKSSARTPWQALWQHVVNQHWNEQQELINRIVIKEDLERYRRMSELFGITISYKG